MGEWAPLLPQYPVVPPPPPPFPSGCVAEASRKALVGAQSIKFNLGLNVVEGHVKAKPDSISPLLSLYCLHIHIRGFNCFRDL